MGRTGRKSRATASRTRSKVDIELVTRAARFALKQAAELIRRTARTYFGGTMVDAQPRTDLPKTEADPVVQQEGCSVARRYLGQRVSQFHATDHTILASRRHRLKR